MNQPKPHPVKKILFVGHEASYTGAPILLLHLLQWLKRNDEVQFEILLKVGGPLENKFAALAPTTVLRHSRVERLLCTFFNRLGWQIPAWLSLPAKAVRHAQRRKVEFVYGNTVAVAEEMSALSMLMLPMVWHVHELPFVIQSFDAGRPFQKAKQSVGDYIAASEAVKQGLVDDYSIPAEKIKVIHEFIPPLEMDAENRKASRAAVRQELSLPFDAFIVGMCGTVDWRKGCDWFIAVAKHLLGEFPAHEIYFLWIGSAHPDIRRQVDHDLRLAGLLNRVKFIGVQADSRRYLAALDVFMLSSREDPFPLVMLEAAALALPIICFNRSGGGPEFVGKDAGLVVDYADTLSMAKTLVQLSEQPALMARLGMAAKQKVMDHYTVEIQVPKILQLIKEIA